MAKPKKAKDIDGYTSQFPADVRAILQKVRTTIGSAAPEAKETIVKLRVKQDLAKATAKRKQKK